MIITTDDKGKETKYTYSQYKKIFAEKQGKFLHKKIIEALKKNLGELSNSGHEILSPSYYITKIGLPDEFVCGLAFKPTSFLHKNDSPWRNRRHSAQNRTHKLTLNTNVE